MEKNEAIARLEELKRDYSKKIPESETRARAILHDRITGAREHLETLYQNQMKVAQNFEPLQEYLSNPKYLFWLKGIKKHLKECEKVAGCFEGGF